MGRIQKAHPWDRIGELFLIMNLVSVDSAPVLCSLWIWPHCPITEYDWRSSVPTAHVTVWAFGVLHIIYSTLPLWVDAWCFQL